MASPQVTVSLPQRQPRRRRQQQMMPNQTRNRRRRARRRQQSQAQPTQQRRRQPRRQRRNLTTRATVRREVTRLGLTGPNPTIVQKATATLGSVQPNQSGALELEFQMCLNPSLVKESTGSNQFGPIQISASTYSLWKLRSAYFHFQPLVGASAVSGTVYRISLNLSGSPGSNSWSALGARHHLDVTPGQAKRFHVPKRMLQGTKEGWFVTDPKADPTNSLGGSVEVHSLGKTMSTYQSNQFTGDLFLLEMTATWEFTNYNVQPGLLTMVKDQHQSKVEIKSSGNGSPLVMEVPVNSKLSNYTGGASHAAAASGSLGETIWSIVDTGVNTLSGVVPPPFGWLVKGGWWFVRRILGKSTNSSNEEVAQFYIYQTLADAQNDNRCITTSADTASVASGEYDIQQITPGNVGLPDAPPSSYAMQPAAYDPTQPLHLSTVYKQLSRPSVDSTPYFSANLAQNGTQTFSLGIQRSSGPDPRFWTVTQCLNPTFFQNGSAVTPLPDLLQNRVPIMQHDPSNAATVVGYAYYYSSYNVNLQSGAIVRFVHLLAHFPNAQDLKITYNTTRTQNVLIVPEWVTSTTSQATQTYQVEVATTESVTDARTMSVPANTWVLLTTAGNSRTQNLYGIDFGTENHGAQLTDRNPVTSLPADTPWNPMSNGFRLTPIPRNSQRVFEPGPYYMDDGLEDDYSSSGYLTEDSIEEDSEDEEPASPSDDESESAVADLCPLGQRLYDDFRARGTDHLTSLRATRLLVSRSILDLLGDS